MIFLLEMVQFLVVYSLLTIPDHRRSRDLVLRGLFLNVPQCS